MEYSNVIISVEEAPVMFAAVIKRLICLDAE